MKKLLCLSLAVLLLFPIHIRSEYNAPPPVPSDPPASGPQDAISDHLSRGMRYLSEDGQKSHRVTEAVSQGKAFIQDAINELKPQLKEFTDTLKNKASFDSTFSSLTDKQDRLGALMELIRYQKDVLQQKSIVQIKEAKNLIESIRESHQTLWSSLPSLTSTGPMRSVELSKETLRLIESAKELNILSNLNSGPDPSPVDVHQSLDISDAELQATLKSMIAYEYRLRIISLNLERANTELSELEISEETPDITLIEFPGVHSPNYLSLGYEAPSRQLVRSAITKMASCWNDASKGDSPKSQFMTRVRAAFQKAKSLHSAKDTERLAIISEVFNTYRKDGESVRAVLTRSAHRLFQHALASALDKLLKVEVLVTTKQNSNNLTPETKTCGYSLLQQFKASQSPGIKIYANTAYSLDEHNAIVRPEGKQANVYIFNGHVLKVEILEWFRKQIKEDYIALKEQTGSPETYDQAAIVSAKQVYIESTKKKFEAFTHELNEVFDWLKLYTPVEESTAINSVIKYRNDKAKTLETALRKATFDFSRLVQESKVAVEDLGGISTFYSFIKVSFTHPVEMLNRVTLHLVSNGVLFGPALGTTSVGETLDVAIEFAKSKGITISKIEDLEGFYRNELQALNSEIASLRSGPIQSALLAMSAHENDKTLLQMFRTRMTREQVDNDYEKAISIFDDEFARVNSEWKGKIISKIQEVEIARNATKAVFLIGMGIGTSFFTNASATGLVMPIIVTTAVDLLTVTAFHSLEYGLGRKVNPSEVALDFLVGGLGNVGASVGRELVNQVSRLTYIRNFIKSSNHNAYIVHMVGGTFVSASATALTLPFSFATTHGRMPGISDLTNPELVIPAIINVGIGGLLAIGTPGRATVMRHRILLDDARTGIPGTFILNPPKEAYLNDDALTFLGARKNTKTAIIFVHGGDDGDAVYNGEVIPVNRIAELPEIQEAEEVLIVSCSLAIGKSKTAQQLSKSIGKSVIAATGDVNLKYNPTTGKTDVTIHESKNLVLFPWLRFSPDGGSVPVLKKEFNSLIDPDVISIKNWNQ